MQRTGGPAPKSTIFDPRGKTLDPGEAPSDRPYVLVGDIASVVRAGTAGFNLEDVQVLFSEDVDLDVSGVRVEGRRGEMANLPRWVAEVVSEQGRGEMQDEDSFVELKQAVVKENAQGEFDVARLDGHFYIRLRAYTRRLPERDRERADSLLNGLVRKRRGKLVRLADSSELTAEISAKLSIEERAFYEAVRQASEGFERAMLGGA